MAKGGKIRIKIDDQSTKALEALRLTLRSPELTQEMQRGGEIMALAVRQRAPIRTGTLRKGVYTASSLRNNYVALTRGGRKVNAPLPRPPSKPGYVLVVSSVYYGMFVEKGRKPRAADPTRGVKHERRAVGKMAGRLRGRQFFRPAIRASRPTAESYIRRRIDRIIAEKASR